MLKPATVKLAPVPTSRLPLMAKANAVVAVAVPLRIRLPLIVATLVSVLRPLPERVKC
jgi:hypothetical protein